MSNVPAELKYVDTHEWLRVEADGTVTIGITDHAQELLGDVVYVELPEVGANYAAGDTAGVVESVKAASDIYAPIAGEVVAINEELPNAPESANSDPYGEAWFFRVKPANPADLDGLLDAAGYAALIGA
ncbi:glycine cleavage system protein GcvH [Chitinolyticbacter meiyuanensis]|uniref:glycine cleavage system protein GcvH n=1 Tax=Chitinolyticbacter meiyuanensis TaxID=682798 RepID=UPI0011E5CC20|nr:glycine cleavage system protein GcvH [Chitinolyticbacter meiyuanensis]